MNPHRFAIHGFLVGMLALPFVPLAERWLEAAPGGMPGFQDGLLLNRPVETPALDRLAKLDALVIANYTLRPYEDVWAICHRFKIDQFTIRSSNDLDESPAPGTVLRIPNRDGTLYHIQTPESLRTVTSGFEAGRKGGATYERQVLELNRYPLPELTAADRLLKTGTVLFLPSAYKPIGLQPPFSLKYKTSGFGSRRHPVSGVTRAHKGYDLARPYGSAVTVTREGTVTFAGWMGGYGNMIEIRHVMKSGRVRYTRYGHLSKILVREGQHVHMYQLIGRVGSTGISTGPHLHFEVRDESGAARNPNRFF